MLRSTCRQSPRTRGSHRSERENGFWHQSHFDVTYFNKHNPHVCAWAFTFSDLFPAILWAMCSLNAGSIGASAPAIQRKTPEEDNPVSGWDTIRTIHWYIIILYLYTNWLHFSVQSRVLCDFPQYSKNARIPGPLQGIHIEIGPKGRNLANWPLFVSFPSSRYTVFNRHVA